MTEPVLVERRDAVQWITIDRPERRNAINEAVIAAIVLTGAGEGMRAFQEKRAPRWTGR